MRVGWKGSVDCVALWDDCDIKQQNYQWKPHKVWKVTKIGQTTACMPPHWLAWQEGALTNRSETGHPSDAGHKANHGNS
jgi:hypothetical protein